MPDIDGTSPEGLTRREALKRGAAFGGALLWATPVVQAIGMSAAAANETSGNNCKTYCIKYEFVNDNDVTGTWSSLGEGRGNCFTCPPGAENTEPPASFFDEFEVYTDAGESPETYVYVRYPDSCSLAETDSSPDELAEGAAAAKCGSGLGLCNFVPWTKEEPDPSKPGFNRVRIDACANGKAISHIELIIRCCP